MSREQTVRDVAYAIWEAEGKPQGRDAEHWRLAEQRVAASLAGGSAKAQSRKAEAKPSAKGKVAAGAKVPAGVKVPAGAKDAPVAKAPAKPAATKAARMTTKVAPTKAAPRKKT